MEVTVPKCLAVGNITFPLRASNFRVFLGGLSLDSVGVFSWLSRLAPGWVELPPRAAEQCLGPLRCGVWGCDRIQDGYSQVVFFFEDFPKESFCQPFFGGDETHQLEKEINISLGGGVSQICLEFSPPIPGRMIQFDEHIFKMGWFNHQLVIVVNGVMWHQKIALKLG